MRIEPKGAHVHHKACTWVKRPAEGGRVLYGWGPSAASAENARRCERPLIDGAVAVRHRVARIIQASCMFLLAFRANADAARAADFGNLRDQYVKTFLRRFPVVATYLGAEGLDPLLISVNGTLRDHSDSGLENERKEWVRFQRELS